MLQKAETELSEATEEEDRMGRDLFSIAVGLLQEVVEDDEEEEVDDNEAKKRKLESASTAVAKKTRRKTPTPTATITATAAAVIAPTAAAKASTTLDSFISSRRSTAAKPAATADIATPTALGRPRRGGSAAEAEATSRSAKDKIMVAFGRRKEIRGKHGSNGKGSV